jgi:hypothetical protein
LKGERSANDVDAAQQKSAEAATRWQVTRRFSASPCRLPEQSRENRRGRTHDEKDNVDKLMMNPLHTGGSARMRFNGGRLNLGASSRRVIMVRKLVLILVAATAVGGAAFTPAAASAGWYGYGHRADIRADRRDLRRDRADFRRDFGDLRRDLRTGRFGDASRDLADLRRDRQDIRRDRGDLRRDRRDLFFDRHGY